MNWTLASDQRLQTQLKWLYKCLTKEDGAGISTPEAHSFIMASLKAAYAQGSDGVIRDAQIYSTPWEFELSNVQREVQLFCGRKDDRTPVVFGRYYKEHLPRAELIELEDASHFTMDRYDEEVMPKIFGAGRSKERSEVGR